MGKYSTHPKCFNDLSWDGSVSKVTFLKNGFPLLQVPLGLIAKNENVNEDMVDILNHLQSLYVPMKERQLPTGSTERIPVQTVFFGGDQLTEERARNVQLARSDGTTSEERLSGVWPKNEDWHAISIAYDVRNWLKGNNQFILRHLTQQVQLWAPVLWLTSPCRQYCYKVFRVPNVNTCNCIFYCSNLLEWKCEVANPSRCMECSH